MTMSEEAPVVSMRKKLPNYTQAEDEVILKEVYATKAYCLTNRQSELFDEVAKRLRQSDVCKSKDVSGRSARDRFSRLVKNYSTSDRYNRGKSGVNSDFTEVDRLLCEMAFAMDDIAEEKNAVREADKLKSKSQKRMNEMILDFAAHRRANKLSQLENGNEARPEDSENAKGLAQSASTKSCDTSISNWKKAHSSEKDILEDVANDLSNAESVKLNDGTPTKRRHKNIEQNKSEFQMIFGCNA